MIAQSSGASTTWLFAYNRWTAHVQQNGNRLDVVIAVAGNNTPALPAVRGISIGQMMTGVRSASLTPTIASSLLETTTP